MTTREQRWIACTLEPVFGKRAGLMMPTSYTELFFLDEATALAAGHRPCKACRRADYLAFVAAWRKAGLPLPGKGGVAEAIDARLEGERRAASRPRLLLGELPQGAIVRLEGGEFALVEKGGRLLTWSFEGYMRQPDDAARHEAVEVMTPMSIIEVLRVGYQPAIHPSAAGAALEAVSSPARLAVRPAGLPPLLGDATVTATIGDLFLERPEQWGLRGDPYLWDEMANALALEPLPASDTVLLVKLADAFRESTGVSLGNPCEMVEVERFAHGGMSSGFVHLEFWLETALPLLIRRAGRLRAPKEGRAGCRRRQERPESSGS